jgi:putative ubiquitin-RnfH superfamily antitoxin RatB of RatAB toxin-antitoxin module
MAAARFEVEVVCAMSDQQLAVAIEVPAGTSLRHAVERSRILEQLPPLALDGIRFGIHGELRDPDTLLKAGDRVEIYRPMTADPRALRRRRAHGRR